MNWVENIKILLADDDDVSCNIAKIFLVKNWIKSENIVTVHNWNQAVNVAKEQLFDLILMDIKMPWKTWIDATKEIRNHHNWNSPKIVAYSADLITYYDIINRELFDAFIIKPVNKESFQDSISICSLV